MIKILESWIFALDENIFVQVKIEKETYHIIFFHNI